MQLTGRRRRSLRPAGAVLVALAMVAAACGGDDDEAASVVPDGESTITTLMTGSEGMDIPAADDAGGMDPPNENGDGSGEDDPADGADGLDRFGAPAPGRYRYRVPNDEDRDNDFFYAFRDLEHLGDSLVVLRQIYGHGFDNRFELLWSDDGSVRVLREQRSDSGLAGPVCDWTPDLLIYPAQLSVGMEWTEESSCEGGTEDARRTRSDTAEVTGTETLTVDGQAIDVVVIERTEVIVSTVGTVEVVERTERTERYSPSGGLLVAAQGRRIATYPGGSTNPVGFGEELVSADPESG